LSFGGSIPEELRPILGAEAAIGCDICQDVCPWNRKSARDAGLPNFLPRRIDVPEDSQRPAENGPLAIFTRP